MSVVRTFFFLIKEENWKKESVGPALRLGYSILCKVIGKLKPEARK